MSGVHSARALALLLLPLLLASCGESRESAEGLFFPTHGSSDAPASQALGELGVANECVVLVDPGGSDLLPIWPSGFYFDGTSVRDGNQAVIARLGEQLNLEGGLVSESVAADLMGQGIPQACAEAAPFMVSGVINVGTDG